MTTYRQTLPYSLFAAVFIITGAISVQSAWPLVVLPVPFLVAWLVQKGLNNPVVLQDNIDDARFKPLLSKIDVERHYSIKEEQLTEADRTILNAAHSDGYQYPEGYIRKRIANNQKKIYQGHITGKYIHEGDYLITLGNTVSMDIPEGTYQKLTLGDYIRLTVAFARISGFSKPTFVLACEILNPAEELEK